MVMVAVITLGLQGCEQTQDIEWDLSDPINPNFSAENVDASGPIKIIAKPSKNPMSLNVTFNLIVNGESQTYNMKCKSNELPVVGGNEVKLTAQFSFISVTEYMRFSMPDGTEKFVSKDKPECSWTVPDDFAPGSLITAHWVDKDGNEVEKNWVSDITLISAGE